MAEAKVHSLIHQQKPSLVQKATSLSRIYKLQCAVSVTAYESYRGV